MGFDGRDGEWDRLVLAFDELREEGKKNISFEEFRRVLLSAGDAEGGRRPGGDGCGHPQHAPRTSCAPPFMHLPRSARPHRRRRRRVVGRPADLPPPAPSSPRFDGNPSNDQNLVRLPPPSRFPVVARREVHTLAYRRVRSRADVGGPAPS